jgi:hypothetical protein
LVWSVYALDAVAKATTEQAMSATPRTDEMELKGQPAIGGKAFIHSDFARTLERENQALREAMESALLDLSMPGEHSAAATLRAALNKNSPVATAVGS